MKRTFRKNIFRTIKKSMGRYLAIFTIIALGVGFFCGLKASKPSMIKTAQDYLQEGKLYDYRLISTWGIEEKELEELKEMDGVTDVEGAVWEDFIYRNEADEEHILKALSITENMNLLTVAAGELPKEADECVLDVYFASEDMIGKEIRISGENTEEIKNSFRYDTYKVTGIVHSPLYINPERGTTTVGSGRVSGYVYIPLEGFSYDYFKEAYMLTDTQGKAFTDAYEDSINSRRDGMKESASEVFYSRFEKEMAEANQKMEDARRELKEKTDDAKAELRTAKAELEDGERKIAEGKQEIADSGQRLSDSKAELEDGAAALAEGEEKYNQALADYQAGRTQYEAGAAILEQNRGQYEQAGEQLQYLVSLGADETDETYRMLSQSIADFEVNEQQLAQVKQELDSGKQELDASQTQLEASRVQIQSGRKQIEEGRAKLYEAEAELAKKEEELADGWKKYEDGLKELEEETSRAETEIADARKEVDALEAPEIYVLERGSNVGYASYESDVSIVEGIARVFPVFFFLIAALICSTTMTRMVDDERTQIGTLRALGYTKGAILFKYLVYSGSAAGLGAALGYFAGVRLFPRAIWAAYGILYGFAEITIVDNIPMFLISLAVALLCSMGTTFAACRLELGRTPADLIRPKAPAAGKRILLERVPWIWKHMKFLHKVSARNIFRFKKRMIMMILGISGCTALVVAGFGVNDSVKGIVDNQYDHILKYDINAAYTEEVNSDILNKIDEEAGPDIEKKTVLLETSADVLYSKGEKNAVVMVSENDSIRQCVDFHQDGRQLSLPGKGEVLIDNRLANLLNVKTGDRIILKAGGEELKPLKISGIFENYAYYYIYASAETYEEYFHEDFAPKSIYLTLKEGADEYKLGSYLSNMETAANVTIVSEIRSRVGNMLNSMNYIVALIIGCAGVLAFVVLFNLGNINISERVREIATLKVLGFYPRETSSYVFRENMVLSMMGMVLGLPLGVLFHHFIIQQIKIDMVSFRIYIRPVSFLFSVLTVLCFTVFVDLMMRRKIEGIHMAESLKSID